MASCAASSREEGGGRREGGREEGGGKEGEKRVICLCYIGTLSLTYSSSVDTQWLP